MFIVLGTETKSSIDHKYGISIVFKIILGFAGAKIAQIVNICTSYSSLSNDKSMK